MLKTIRVYGRLAKFLGRRKFEAEVQNAAEAVRFLLANFPRLEQHLVEHDYRVSVGEYDLTENELNYPAGQETIKIIPVLSGAGSVGKIIAGVALVALAVFVPLGSIGLGAMGSIGIGSIVSSVGASLVIGGVSQLLSPVPTLNGPGAGNRGNESATDPRKSYSFSGIQQSSRAGVPVPVVYGETIVGSVVISVGIDTVQI